MKLRFWVEADCLRFRFEAGEEWAVPRSAVVAVLTSYGLKGTLVHVGDGSRESSVLTTAPFDVVFSAWRRGQEGDAWVQEPDGRWRHVTKDGDP